MTKQNKPKIPTKKKQKKQQPYTTKETPTS